MTESIFSHLLSQIALHLAPSVPKGVIRAGMKRPLKSLHPVLQVHNEELLSDHGGRVVEGQEGPEKLSRQSQNVFMKPRRVVE